ncbi:MAG: 4-hydroxy-2-oxovalerate aldolase [Opitutae bacterium]|nr:4-hydroxy-2-oxovalerate aldolase [Opitutae bacterium]
MKDILISDPTLRDGNHAVMHQLNPAQIAAYCTAADAAGIPIVEVGHGNGLAASSLQLGQSLVSDHEMLRVAREKLTRSQLGVFIIPGFGTIKRDLAPAIDLGADVVRVGSHCTEADTTARHLAYARERGKHAYGNLMMSHMASPATLLAECRKMQSYGAEGVVLMDSAGALLPGDVRERFEVLVGGLEIPVGFHAHNNLGLAIANSLVAVEAGARILDGTARGFGAGAGNAQLEVLVAVLQKLGYTTGIDLYKMLDLSDVAEKHVIKSIPIVRPTSVVSGLAGVVSTFAKHVDRISLQYGIDPRDLFFELGRRKVVAGQEDIIIAAAMDLAHERRPAA